MANEPKTECPLNHPHLKVSLEAWLTGTVRLPHVPDHEAAQEGEHLLWVRNCICGSTVSVDPTRFIDQVVPLAVAA